MKNQNAEILHYLQGGNKITPIEALIKFGCFRLSARIHDLREAGFNIETERVVKGKKSFASYSLK